MMGFEPSPFDHLTIRPVVCELQWSVPVIRKQVPTEKCMYGSQKHELQYRIEQVVLGSTYFDHFLSCCLGSLQHTIYKHVLPLVGCNQRLPLFLYPLTDASQWTTCQSFQVIYSGWLRRSRIWIWLVHFSPTVPVLLRWLLLYLLAFYFPDSARHPAGAKMSVTQNKLPCNPCHIGELELKKPLQLFHMQILELTRCQNSI